MWLFKITRIQHDLTIKHDEITRTNLVAFSWGKFFITEFINHWRIIDGWKSLDCLIFSRQIINSFISGMCFIRISFVSFMLVCVSLVGLEPLSFIYFSFIFVYIYLSLVDLSDKRILGNVFICDAKHSIDWSLTILFVKEEIFFGSSSYWLLQFGLNRFYYYIFLVWPGL